MIEPRFDLAGPFRFGRAEVLVGQHLGIIDRQRALTVAPKYARAVPIIPDVTLVEIGAWHRRHYQGSENLDISVISFIRGNYGLLTVQNTWIIEPNRHLSFRTFDPEGRRYVWAAPRSSSGTEVFDLIDARTGQWKIEPIYQSVSPLSENRAVASEVAFVKERNGVDVLANNGEIIFHTLRRACGGYASLDGHTTHCYWKDFTVKICKRM